MINFPALRTKRITARLKELSMLDAIALASFDKRSNNNLASTSFLEVVRPQIAALPFSDFPLQTLRRSKRTNYLQLAISC